MKKKKPALKAKRKKKKLLKSGILRKKAHASSRNKRTQARKDGRGKK